MTSGVAAAQGKRSKARTVELFVFALLVALGATTVVTVSWARDVAEPRVTLLGSERGISMLITAGSARVLIVNGTNSAELGNALSKARHPGLDRIDLMIVSGNAAASELVPRAIEILNPREVISVGSIASLAGTSITPRKVIDRAAEIELPEGVTIDIQVWPAANGENDDVTWSASVERGGASIYWVSDREDLMQDSLPQQADVTVIGRGAPTNDTPLPNTRVIVAAGESISGPQLRALVLDSLGPEVETKRVFAGEELRISLDSEGIRRVSGSTPAGSPEAG